MSRAGDLHHFYSWDRGQRGDGYSERGRKERVRYVLSRAKGATYTHFCESGGTYKLFRWPSGDQITELNIAGTAPRAGTASEGIMVLSDEEVAVLIAELERENKDLESIRRKNETIRRETGAMKADLEEKKRELERLQYGTDLEWRQSETVDMPMSPLLQGPDQSAPTTVALAAESPAAEVATDTRVLPDTAAPNTSVERAATKLTSAAGPSSKISGERRASTGTLVPLAIRYNNNNSSKSNNDTTTTCVVALLRPFDSGKGMPAGCEDRGSSRFGSPL